MDGIAKRLGLDIEALALQLALNGSSLPIQSLPVQIDDEPKKAIKEQFLKVPVYSPPKHQYSPLIKTKGTQYSPIINPIVIRPTVQNNVYYSPGSASNVSSAVSKKSRAQPKASNNNPFQPMFGARNQQPAAGDSFNRDKINQAFQNLFGGSFGSNTNAMQTPQFNNDNKHQIKAKPIYSAFDTPGNYLNNKPANARSVFSPIPCIPQSEANILGVRGDRNTPYTPFSRQQEQFTPKVLQVAGAGQRKVEGKKQITPGQFLNIAQP